MSDATHTLRSQLTLAELAKRTIDKDIAAVAEVLNETNEALQDAVWVEANQVTSHITTKRVSLPAGTWRKINSGIGREASTTKQLVATMGLLEAYSVVDKFLVDIAPDKRAFRSSEDLAFVEGMGQTFADCLFRYANADTPKMPGDMTTHPERFDGFPIRYTDVSDSDNVMTPPTTGDSAGACTSIWIIQWSPSMVHLIYPKGSTIGISMQDLGECTVLATDSPLTTPLEFQAYRTHFKLNVGLVVRDDRCVQRMCNIEPAETSGAGVFDEDILIELCNNLPYGGKNAVMYMNRTMKTILDIAAKDTGNLSVSQVNDAFGKPVTLFWGLPIRRVDAITNTEGVVTA